MANEIRIWTQAGILSFQKQIELIARAASLEGYSPKIVDIMVRVNPFHERVNKQLLFYVGMPHILLWAWKMSWKAYADASLSYATVEGRPKVNKHISNLISSLRVIGVSRFAAERLKEVGANVIGWVPHAIDSIEFQDLPGKDPEKKDIFLVGFVGSPIPRKGLRLLNEASKIVWEKGYKNIRFLIWSQHYGNLELPSGPNIDIYDKFGRVGHKEVINFYSGLDLYVQPSLAEGFGIPMLEAMAAGIPVVSSNGGPMGELNNEEHGYIVKWKELRYEDHGLQQDFFCFYYDPADLASRIIEAFENPKERLEKGQKAKEYAWKNYNYEDVYRRLIRMI
jgi:glycosyltransferase involved in cell wall biosynthesis